MKSGPETPTTLQLELRGALKEGIARLNAASVPSSALAAELLLMHALGRSRTWLYTHAEDGLEADAADKYFVLIARRAAGEPVQYIVGTQEFWGLEFEVTPAVLIPRPETEHLIEVAIERLGSRRSEAMHIADVGTGSGCIAVALAKEFSNAQIIATDIFVDALEIAKRNATRHRFEDRIQFVEADLLRPTRHSPRVTSHSLSPPNLLHLIVSNPPYIARSDAHTLQREIREYEPEVALYGGETGLEMYARLIDQSVQMLAPGGTLAMELGYGAAERVREMFNSAEWKNLSITNDLAAIPRVIAADRA
jgi:release factor glutamine methyltransferase